MNIKQAWKSWRARLRYRLRKRRKPPKDLVAWTVTEDELGDRQWSEIGYARKAKNGEMIEVRLDAVPVSGAITNRDQSKNAPPPSGNR